MHRARVRHLVIIVGFMFSASASVASDGEVLDLVSAVKLTLSNDYDIRINATGVDEKRGLALRALGEFDYNLSATLSRDHSETPSASSLDGVATAVISDSTSIKPTLAKKTSWGTDVSVPYSYSVTESNSTYASFPTSHNTSFGLKLSQPLLKPFTRSYFLKGHEKAESDLKIAEIKHGEQLQDNVNKTIGFFADVIRSRETLKIRKRSEDDATQTLEAARAKQDAGRSSVLDVLEAQTASHKSVDARLQAEADLAANNERLALKIYGDAGRQVNVVDDLQKYLRAPAPTDLNVIWREALAKRPDAQSARLNEEQAARELTFATADKRPNVSFEGNVTYKGLDDSFSVAQEQVIGGDFPSYSAGLKLEQPLMRYAARGEHQVKTSRLEQERLKRQQIERASFLSLRKGLRDMDTTWKRIQALELASRAEKERILGQTRRFEQGRISIFDLNRAREDRENVELELIKAKIAFVRARFELARAQGRLLEELGLITAP